MDISIVMIDLANIPRRDHSMFLKFDYVSVLIVDSHMHNDAKYVVATWKRKGKAGTCNQPNV